MQSLDPFAVAPAAVTFFAPGEARPAPRPVGIRSGPRRGSVYAPTSADQWMHQVRASCIEHRPADRPWPRDGAFHVSLLFRFERPASHRTKHGLSRSAPRGHTQKPDIDNLSKAVLDALSAWDDLPPLLWHNDAQVAVLHASKTWTLDGERAGVSVRVIGVGE